MSELRGCFLKGKARLTELIDPKHRPQALCLDRPPDSLTSCLQWELRVSLRSSLTPHVCVPGQEARDVRPAIACSSSRTGRNSLLQPLKDTVTHYDLSTLWWWGNGEQQSDGRTSHVAMPGFHGKMMLPCQATATERERGVLASRGQLLTPGQGRGQAVAPLSLT